MLKHALIPLFLFAFGTSIANYTYSETNDRFSLDNDSPRLLEPRTGRNLPKAKIQDDIELVSKSLRTVNMNAIGNADGVLQANVNGADIGTCTPGKETPQNEVTGAVNPEDPDNVVMGANDYRFINETVQKYDGSGGVFHTKDGGKTWKQDFLPGVVRWNPAAPGDFEDASDPSISASAHNVFWYATLGVDREDSGTGILISRSTDGGDTWKTTSAFQTKHPPSASGILVNDKLWIAADPNNPDVAYVTWTQFIQGHPFASIVYTKTTDGGQHWTKPRRISRGEDNQGSFIVVDANGVAHAVWLSFRNDSFVIDYARTQGKRFSKPKTIAIVDPIRSPVPWGKFFTNSFPSLAVDGTTLHIVWPNWNGNDADLAYIRSDDAGVSWTTPVTIDNHSDDQFLPRIGAAGGRVAVGYLDHFGEKKSAYHVTAVGSLDHGNSWSVPYKISSRDSDPLKGNIFAFPDCNSIFIGDYNGVSVDSLGRAYVFWTDIRKGNSPGDPGTTFDQDPYAAIVEIRKLKK